METCLKWHRLSLLEMSSLSIVTEAIMIATQSTALYGELREELSTRDRRDNSSLRFELPTLIKVLLQRSQSRLPLNVQRTLRTCMLLESLSANWSYGVVVNLGDFDKSTLLRRLRPNFSCPGFESRYDLFFGIFLLPDDAGR